MPRAGQVIWAGDGHKLIFEILGGKYLYEKIKNMYDTWIPVKPIVHVMMGVDMDLSAEPHHLIFETEEPITIAGKEHRWTAMLHHCFDPSMVEVIDVPTPVTYNEYTGNWKGSPDG